MHATDPQPPPADDVPGAGAGGGYEVLLYYTYTPIGDVGAFVEAQRSLCGELGLLGRIIVAGEGINGTLSGRAAATARYREAMASLPETAAMPFKVSPSPGHAFGKLSVKARPELVTLGLRAGDDVDPNTLTGEHLTPSEFYRAMQDPDVVVLDGRNEYESRLGRFRGAVCPDVEHFRDFPDWVREHLAGQEGKRVLTYCTGGIRCEKLSGYLLRCGFENVAQLEGGIVSYGADPEVSGRDFEGSCYVFDGRINVDVNSSNPTLVSHCIRCGAPCGRYRNCGFPPCNAQIILCGSCEEGEGRYCDPRCRGAHRGHPAAGAGGAAAYR